MLFVDLVGRHMTVETTYKTFAVYASSFKMDIFSHLDISHIVEEMAYVYVVACTLYMHKIWSKDL